MVHLNDSVMAGGDVIGDEMLFPDNLTNLTKQQAICIRGAKKLEKECTQIEMEFFQKVQELEAQFYPRFKDIIEKRQQILNGSIALTEDDVSDVPILYNLDEKARGHFTQNLKDDSSINGIPHFWLHVLQNCPATSIMVEDHDVSILKHLIHIDADISTSPMGSILRFHFEPNEFFDNTIIEKKTIYKLAPNDLHLFDGPSVASCENTPIAWKEGKNPCGTAAEPKDSFFHLFDAKTDAAELEEDCDVIDLIRDKIIPHASLFFSGELQDDDIEFSDGDSEDSTDDEESNGEGEVMQE